MEWGNDVDIELIKKELAKLEEKYTGIKFDFIIFTHNPNTKNKYKIKLVKHSNNITEFISNHEFKENINAEQSDIVPIKFVLSKYKYCQKSFKKKLKLTELLIKSYL